jgi:hypothetical protein
LDDRRAQSTTLIGTGIILDKSFAINVLPPSSAPVPSLPQRNMFPSFDGADFC